MSTLPTVLVVDDDPDIAHFVRFALSTVAHVITATNLDEARAALATRPPLILLDLELGPVSSDSFVGEIRDTSPQSRIVVFSAVQDLNRAMELMRAGAEDYLTKPIHPSDLLNRVQRIIQEHIPATIHTIPAIDGNPSWQLLRNTKNRQMEQVLHKLSPSASSTLPILITGETGTGKELVARAIHGLSARSNQKFIAINCSSFSPELIEAELFGHTEGAFTGSSGSRLGLVREAGGGTLFLDEIGELPESLQPRLLRFLQDGEVRPVGSDRAVQSDTRVIAATHQKLSQLIAEGRFREDLYYRLAAVNLDLPPLRERAEDISALADFFLQQESESLGKELSFEKSSYRALTAHSWPGNIRELENRIKQAALFCTSIIGIEALGLGNPSFTAGELGWPVDLLGLPFRQAESQVKDSFETAYVQAALSAADGNLSKAARESEIPRKSFWRMAKRLGISAKGGTEVKQPTIDPSKNDRALALMAMIEKERNAYRQRVYSQLSEVENTLSGAEDQIDWPWIRTIAHRTRGSAGSYGIDAASEIAADWELAAEAKNKIDCLSYIQQIMAILKNR